MLTLSPSSQIVKFTNAYNSYRIYRNDTLCNVVIKFIFAILFCTAFYAASAYTFLSMVISPIVGVIYGFPTMMMHGFAEFNIVSGVIIWCIIASICVLLLVSYAIAISIDWALRRPTELIVKILDSRLYYKVRNTLCVRVKVDY